RRVTLEDLAIASAETRARGIVERKFPRREEPNVGHRIERALTVYVEGLDRFDLLVEQIDPVGQCASHRVEVDQPAANAEFSGRDDLRDMLVAAERELRAQRVDIELLALGEKERERREIRWRRESVERGRRRDEEHVALAARCVIERREPLGDQVLMRRKAVVG